MVHLNLGQIHAFTVVARLRSFGLAAQQLGISDRAISQEIKKLEESLGKKLISRDTRFRGLTAFGKRYLSEMEPLLIKLEAVIEFLRGVLSQPPELVLSDLTRSRTDPGPQT